MSTTLRNTTDQEAAVLLRLAKEGVHPADINNTMRQELYRVPFSQLSMNQQAQAYGDYREETGDAYCSYSSFCEAVASFTHWDKETGRPWGGRYFHRNEWVTLDGLA